MEETGEIIELARFMSEPECLEYWQVSIRYLKKPKLMLGTCIVTQTEDMEETVMKRVQDI